METKYVLRTLYEHQREISTVLFKRAKHWVIIRIRLYQQMRQSIRNFTYSEEFLPSFFHTTPHSISNTWMHKNANNFGRKRFHATVSMSCGYGNKSFNFYLWSLENLMWTTFFFSRKRADKQWLIEYFTFEKVKSTFAKLHFIEICCR